MTRYHKKRQGGQTTPEIERKCLKCGKPFMAETRFLRTCPSCRAVNQRADTGGVDHRPLRRGLSDTGLTYR